MIDEGDIIMLIFYLFLVFMARLARDQAFFLGSLTGSSYFILQLIIPALNNLSFHGLNTFAIIMLSTIIFEYISLRSKCKKQDADSTLYNKKTFEKISREYFPFYLGVCVIALLAELYGTYYGMWENEYGTPFGMGLPIFRVIFFSYFCTFFTVLKLGDCFKNIFKRIEEGKDKIR